jgi:hypothetical protein
MPRTSAAGEGLEPAAVCEILEPGGWSYYRPTVRLCLPCVFLFSFAEFIFFSDLEYSPSIFAEARDYHDGFLPVQN